jgi:hypothetical protein
MRGSTFGHAQKGGFLANIMFFIYSEGVCARTIPYVHMAQNNRLIPLKKLS